MSTAGTTGTTGGAFSSSPSRTRDVRFPVIAGPAPSTPTPASARTGEPRTAAGSPTSAGSPAWSVGAARFAADVCLDLLDGASTERTRLRMVREKPLPFPPEPVAQRRIQAARWSLDRADHSAGQHNLLLNPGSAGSGFRLLTGLRNSFDPTLFNKPDVGSSCRRRRRPIGARRTTRTMTGRKGWTWEHAYRRAEAWEGRFADFPERCLHPDPAGGRQSCAGRPRPGRGPPTPTARTWCAAEVQTDGNFVLSPPTSPSGTPTPRAAERQAGAPGRPQCGALRRRRTGLGLEDQHRRAAAPSPELNKVEEEVAPAAVETPAPAPRPRPRAADLHRGVR